MPLILWVNLSCSLFWRLHILLINSLKLLSRLYLVEVRQSLAGDAPSLNRESPNLLPLALPALPVCCRRREKSRSAGEGYGILQRGAACGSEGAAGCGGSRGNTAAFQTREMMAPGEQHLQTNPGRLYRAGFGLSPPACLELRHLGMMKPGRVDLICWKEQPGT